jgi:hypothetical protein
VVRQEGWEPTAPLLPLLQGTGYSSQITTTESKRAFSLHFKKTNQELIPLRQGTVLGTVIGEQGSGVEGGTEDEEREREREGETGPEQ